MQTSLDFIINNPQIVIQDEIKGSALLLTCKEPIISIFHNYLFINDLKDYKLNIISRQLSLYSVLKSDQKESVIYWMGNPIENKYYLNEEEFNKIIDLPKIEFELRQNIVRFSESNLEMPNIYVYLDNQIKQNINNISLEKENYDIRTEIKFIIDNISGNFTSAYFNDFMNIIDVLIFDRGFSFSQEKKANNQIKEDIKKFKTQELKTKLSNLLPINKISHKIKNHIKFILKKISFNLCNDINKSEDKKIPNYGKINNNLIMLSNYKPLLQFEMKEFIGDHTIRHDKSSENHLYVSELLIKNVEHEVSQPVFQALFNPNKKDLENRLKIINFMKKDRYIKLDTGSIWYILDEFDFNISPFYFHISKKQIIFLLDFFFHNNIQLGEYKKREDEEKRKKKGDEYPIYFRQFKIDEIKCHLNFEYSSEASFFNVPLTKLNLGYFLKNEKFYPFSSMIQRFVGHCKKELIKNVPNILSGMFSSKKYSYKNPEKEDDNEDKEKRKLLFGDK